MWLLLVRKLRRCVPACVRACVRVCVCVCVCVNAVETFVKCIRHFHNIFMDFVWSSKESKCQVSLSLSLSVCHRVHMCLCVWSFSLLTLPIVEFCRILTLYYWTLQSCSQIHLLVLLCSIILHCSVRYLYCNACMSPELHVKKKIFVTFPDTTQLRTNITKSRRSIASIII